MASPLRIAQAFGRRDEEDEFDERFNFMRRGRSGVQDSVESDARGGRIQVPGGGGVRDGGGTTDPGGTGGGGGGGGGGTTDPGQEEEEDPGVGDDGTDDGAAEGEDDTVDTGDGGAEEDSGEESDNPFEPGTRAHACAETFDIGSDAFKLCLVGQNTGNEEGEEKDIREGGEDPDDDAGGTNVGSLPGINVGSGSVRELETILSQFFRPEFERLQEGQEGRIQRLLAEIQEPTDFGRVRGELEAVGTSVADELFRPGGQVEEATSQALRSSVETGFGPTSGGFDRARQNILQGASDQVSRSIARAAPQLAQTAERERRATLSALGGLTQLETGRLESLRESMFGGRGQIENLRLAQQQMDLNQQLVNRALESGNTDIIGALGGAAGGALSGAAAGSFIPGLGTTLGAIIGGAGGLFSGL